MAEILVNMMDKISSNQSIERRRSTLKVRKLSSLEYLHRRTSPKMNTCPGNINQWNYSSRSNLLGKIRKRKGNCQEISSQEAKLVTNNYLIGMLRRNSMSKDPRKLNPPSIFKKNSNLSSSLKDQLSELKRSQNQIHRQIIDNEYEIEKAASQIPMLKSSIIEAQNMLKLLRTTRHNRLPYDKSDINNLNELLRDKEKQNKECQLGLQVEIDEGYLLENAKAVCTHRKHIFVMQNAIMGEFLKSLILTTSTLSTEYLMKHLTRIHGLDYLQDLEKYQVAQTLQAADLPGYISKAKLSLVDNSLKFSNFSNQIRIALQRLEHMVSGLLDKIERCKEEFRLYKEKYNTMLKEFSTINELYMRCNENLKTIRNKHGRIYEDEEQICSRCFKGFYEKNNSPWSCSVHASVWNGEMYWCCAQTKKEAMGCVKSKHVSTELNAIDIRKQIVSSSEDTYMN